MGASDKDSGKDSNGNSTVASRTAASQTVGARTGNGKEVDINVENNTNIKGALIAAGEFDKTGNFVDNKNMKFKTDTLTFANNTNSTFSSNTGFNVGTSVGLTLNAKDSKPSDANDTNKAKVNSSNVGFNVAKGYKRTKTLATLGQGEITISNEKDSDSQDLLNRKTSAINKTLTDVSAGTSVQASIDYRMFTEDGQKQIKEDSTKAGLLIDSVKEVATTKSVSLIEDKADGQTNFMTNNLNKLSVYEGTKKYVTDPKNAKNVKVLLDSNVTAAQKKEALHSQHTKVADEMGITPAEVKVILDKSYQGFTSEQTNKVYIADNIHKTNSDLANTIGNETSDVADMQRDAGVEKTQNYKANRDEYSTQIGNLTEELLNKQYSTNTGSDIKSVVNNKVGTNLNKPNELDSTVINNTREFGKLDKGKGAHRQLNNTEIEFLQNKDNIKKFAITKYGKDYTADDLQSAEHTLGQTAVAMADNAWKKVLGGNESIDETAKEFLQKNVISLKDEHLAEFAKENFGENTSTALENIDFYKNRIHSGIDKNVQQVLKDDINKAKNKIAELKEQGLIKTVKTAGGKVVEYVDESSYKKMGKDGLNLIGTVVADSFGSLIKLGYNASTPAKDIAKIYNISKEEAGTVKAILAVAAASEFGGNKKKIAEGGVDLGIEGKNASKSNSKNDSKVDESDKIDYANKGVYDSKEIRKVLEEKYGKENVTSTTVILNPKQASSDRYDVNVDANGNKSVKVTLDDGTIKNIPYSSKGFPIFDDVAKYTTVITKPNGWEDMKPAKRRAEEMKAATLDLREKINSGTVDKSQFSEEQITDIFKGEKGVQKIPGYTWHHNAEANNMQLVQDNIHDVKKVPHTGEGVMSEGR